MLCLSAENHHESIQNVTADSYNLQDFFYNLPYFSILEKFQEDHVSITKQDSSGAPPTLVTEMIINTAGVIVRKDCRVTVDVMADMLHISHATAFTIMHNCLNMKAYVQVMCQDC